jgi:hypothetical protein
MLYASTRSNLKQQLGLNYFVDEVFGTVLVRRLRKRWYSSIFAIFRAISR